MKYIGLISLLVLIAFTNGQDPIVEIPQGLLRGSIDTDRLGNEFYKFLNIPYAKPPVGSLRFKAPVPADGWEDIREVNNVIPICAQCSNLICPGSEDCLYLHIYTPELPSAESTLKPVMVAIHGGGFQSGNPTDRPKYLLTRDIVLVILNYRLGVLGSFSIDDSELGVPGNAGMKDQSLAIKWVHDNIVYFGGDPQNVMIFGDSAGAGAVHLQVLSPMNEGLFQKALCESGVALFDLMNGVRDNGILIAEQLGIQTENLQDMLVALQEAPVTDILSAQEILLLKYRTIATPLVEIESANESAFLPDEVITLIQTGNYNHVPFVIGHNNVEGLMWQIESIVATGENLTITDFTDFVPPDLQIEQGSEEETIIAERIRQFYYGDTEPSPNDITQAVQLYTDFKFAYPSYRAAVEHAKTSPYPVYFYYFTADTTLNIFKRSEEVAATFSGASHTDEKAYLFNYGNISEIIDGSIEELAIERMVTIWTDFAKYSDPTPNATENIWQPVTEDIFYYYHIDTAESTLKIGPPLPENMEFWQKIYDDFFPSNK